MKQKITVFAILVTGIVALFLLNGLIGATPPTVQAAPLNQAAGASPRTITVQGEGRVRTSSYFAQINMGVEGVAQTIPDAAAQTSKVMESLRAVLKTQGVVEGDIEISAYKVYADASASVSKPAATTYHFSNNVLVTIRSITKTQDILTAVIGAGANNIAVGLFDVPDASILRDQAREDAVKGAKAKADKLAALSGVKVGKVVSISEVVNSSDLSTNYDAFTVREGVVSSPGELDLVARIEITYEIE